MNSKISKNAISVVILSRNESASITRALNSVSWADEILLFDDSDDDTIKKAKTLGLGKKLKIFKVVNQHDFASLRNDALLKVSSEWVLFIDADEEVSKELAKEIQEVISKNENTAFYIKRRDFFLGTWLKYGETGSIGHIKLGKYDVGKWMRPVHEYWDVKENVGSLSNTLNHYPHPTVAEFLAHIDRWTSLDAKVFFDSGVRSSRWKIICYPLGKFLQNYFLKQGLRDGMPGLIMAMMMSFHSFLTRAKLYMLEHKTSIPS